MAGTFDVLHAGHFRLLREAFRRGRRVEVWLADDAMGEAKARAKRQALRPFAERCAALAAWCDAQTAVDCAAADAHENAAGAGVAGAAGAGVAGAAGAGVDNAAAAGDSGASGAAGGAGGVSAGAGAGADAGAEGLGTAGLGAAGLGVTDARFPLRGRFSLHALHDAFGPSVTEPGYTAIACSEETRSGCEAINARRAAAGFSQLEVFVTPVLLGDDGEKLSSSRLRDEAASAAAAAAAAAAANAAL